ncbi:MAG: extracellular solute-binding protein [Gemmataceae bacterium]|nr:extracellular solute-binding protein [Gemmataceae bacterium]
MAAIPFRAGPSPANLGWWCLAFLAALSLAGCSRTPSRVVLYCAQDKEFAELVFGDFKQQTGLSVAPHFDTESTKSVSLYEELVREAQRPRCDVFWNNEIVSTIRLQRKELLEPYASPSAAPYPEWAKAKDDTWHAFAARARVLIVSTKLPEADRPRSLLELTDPRWKGKVAMAKPMFGTSATQAACLFDVLGKGRAMAYYRGLRDNQVQVLDGNKQVAVSVGEGKVPVGITDTDDAIEEVKAGHPVVIIFPDRDAPVGERMGTLFIPNTVAVIRGAPNPDGARKLIDYLLSSEVETRLAETASAQIPLNPNVKAALPPPIEAGRSAKQMQVDWGTAADFWDEAQAFLAKEFARP